MATNEEIVLEFLDVFHTSDPDWARMEAYLANDAYYHVRVPASEKFEGVQAIRNEIETQFKLYEDCVCEVHAYASHGSNVLMERTDHVTMRHNGARVSARICCIFELNDDGKIVAWRDYWDPAPVYEQIGLSEQSLYDTAG